MRSFTIPSALPGQLIIRAQISVSIWFLAKNKNADDKCAEYFEK